MTSDQEMQKDFEASGSIYPKVEASSIEEIMQRVNYDVHVVPNTTTTVITGYIPIGATNFTLCTEIMACVDPRNFNAEKGAKYGIEKAAGAAKNKLWELEGYRLACEIAKANVITTPLERVIAEAKGLDSNISKLDDFIHKSSIYSGLDFVQKELMKQQLALMIQFYAVLVKRAELMQGLVKGDELCR